MTNIVESRTGPALAVQATTEIVNGTRAVFHAVNVLPPTVLLLLGMISLHVGAAVATNLFPVIGTSGTVMLRLGFAAIVLMLIARPELDQTLRDNIALIVLYGAGLAAMNICFYEAIARIPLGIAVSIEFMGPLLLSVVTSRRAMDFFWIGLAIAGLGLLTPDIGTSLDPMGVMFAGFGAVGWASFVVLSKRVSSIFPGESGLALGMSIAALISLPFAFSSLGTMMAQPSILFFGFLVAILSTAVPFSLEFKALKRMPIKSYGVFMTLEPAIAVLVGAAMLGESVGFRGLIAVTCVVLATLGSTLCQRK